MDKQSTEIIENFINFLKEKKEVIQNYEEKYSKSGNEEVVVKRYEWEDIISESYDIISQSIQAIRSLQMENENLRETISTFQALQQSSNLKQSVFTFEDKNRPANDYNIEDHLYCDRNNQYYDEEGEKIKGNELNDINKKIKDRSNLAMTRENDIKITHEDHQLLKNTGSKDLLEEEEILPLKPYQPLKNNVVSPERYNSYEQNNRENSSNDRYKLSIYNNEEVQNIDRDNHSSNSPSFTKSSRRVEMKEHSVRDKHNLDLKQNILIVDSFNINKIEGEDIRNISLSHDNYKKINEDNKHSEDLLTNVENKNSNSISLTKSPLKIGIRQKLKSIVNKDSCNTSRIKTDNPSMNYNVNNQSQTLNLSNIYNKQEKEYEINSVNYSKSTIKYENEDRENLLNEILRKLKSKENFKNYFTLKYSDGSFIEFQNNLYNCEAFLYEVGKELFEIENQINNYPLSEETKSSFNFTSNSNFSLRNNTTGVNISKREEFSKTQTSLGANTKEKNALRACSNKQSNIKKTDVKNNENSYLEPISFEKILRSNGSIIKNEGNTTKKPFNRFANRGNSIDKRKTNRSGEYLNRSKSREFFDNHRQYD